MIDTQVAIKEHDAEIMLIRELLLSLVEMSPSAKQIAENFQKRVEVLCRSAPGDTDPEQIIEIRARAEQYSIFLKEAIGASEARPSHRP